MRITMLANRDLESNLAINYLMEGLSHHTITIFLSDQVGKATTPIKELQDLKFLEQDLFNKFVFPLIEASAPRGNRGLLTFNQLGDRLGTPVRSLNRINHQEGLQPLKDSRPDLILSIRYGHRIKEEALAVPPLGILNLHSGLLPQYQGVLATFRAMFNNDRELGCTLHYIENAEFDMGSIIAQSRLPLDPSKSMLWHVITLYPGGCRLMIEAVQKIEQGAALHATPQADGQYYSFPTSDDFAAFSEMGHKIFDWAEMPEFLKYYFG